MESAWKTACPMMNAGIDLNVKNTRRNKCTNTAYTYTQSYTAYTHIHATAHTMNTYTHKHIHAKNIQKSPKYIQSYTTHNTT